MKLDGARRSARVGGEGELEGKVNYIRGRDPRSWRTGVETYSRVRYRDVYKGVDLVYYGKEGNVEYDFVVAPGADPKSIRFTLEGAPVTLNAEGDLVLKTSGGALTLKKPFLYQDVAGVRREVEGGYALGEDGAVRFRVGRYDRSRPLVIDPVLSNATFFGGGEFDNSYETDIAVDSQGSAYVVGFTNSTEIFPTTPGAFRRIDTKQDGDAFVAKLTPDGSSFVYSTFIGSAYGRSIVVDAAGNAYVTGMAGKDFPVHNGFQTVPAEPSNGGELVDAFVARLNPDGSDLLYSSFLGGNDVDNAFSVAADAQGNAYVSGETGSTNFPITQGAARTTNLADNNLFKLDGFVTKINTNATGAASLVFSTYYGFDRNETGNSIALDSQGSAYVLCGLAPFGIPGIIHTPRGSGVSASASQAGGLNRSGEGGHFVVKLADTAANTMQFSAATFTVGEAGHFATITVTRTGDTSGPAGVEYLTIDGTATGRSDYTSTAGTLRFAAGETSKTFDVLVTDDRIDEADEAAGVALLNPSGGFALGAPLSAAVNILDNDTGVATSNPIDESQFFVRQHYLDFLGREPDASGFQFWTNEIEQCGADAQCREVKRINVSAAFFLSIEFQEMVFYVIRAQRVAFGRKTADINGRLTYREFIRAARSVGEGVIVGEAGAAVRLEANQQAYAESLAAAPAFAENFPASLGASAYVAALFASAGVTPTNAESQAAVAAYGGGGFAGRVAALRSVTDSNSVRVAERNTAFVLMEYLGYLRRDPDQSGYDFWLKKLLEHNGNFVSAEMVKAFITSAEYRRRFGS